MMKRFIAPLLVLALFACTKETVEESSFSVRSESEISADGGTVDLVAEWDNCRYKLSTESDFVTLPTLVYVGKTGISGEQVLSVSFSRNNSESERTAVFVFQPVEGPSSEVVQVSIVQKGYEPVSAKVSVSPSVTYQTWEGFGAMNLGSNWGRHIDWTDADADVLFGTMGLNIMRIRIPYDESDWKTVLDGCKYAYQKYGAVILATPWTMPIYMKTPQQVEASKNGVTSSLNPDHYEEYARYLEKFAAYMKAGGVPVHAVSVQNEPDWTATYEGCIWTAEQHLAFLKDYGHLVTSALLMSGESMGTKHAFYDPALKDAGACANLDIVGGHLYGVKPQSYTLASEKGKPLWMTEHLLNESWNNNGSHWAETMEMLSEINACLVSGWNAYIWWYAKRFYSFLGDGEQGTSKGELLVRGKAYAQYSAHIRPGDVRVKTQVENADGILACAFKGGDGRISLVLLNTLSQPVSDLEVTVDGSTGISAGASCVGETGPVSVACTVKDGKLSLQLPAYCITTIDIK